MKEENEFSSGVLEPDINEFIEMALSDKVPFLSFRQNFDLSEGEVKKIMRASISRKSYVRWRKRVRAMSNKRCFYK